MTSTPHPLAPAVAAVEAFTDQAATRADQVIQASKQAANGALDSLQAGVDGLLQAAPSALGRAAGQVDELARRGLERAREAGHQVQDRATRAADKGVGYVRDEPVKSLLMAAAAGAAVAVLIGWLARSRRPQA